MKRGIHNLTQERLGLIVSVLARQYPFFNDLVVSFTNRKKPLLESILSDVLAGTGSKKYPTPSAQAAALFFYINTKRPFPSGNRRIALAVLFYCLAEEGKWLKVSPLQLQQLAQWVALSPIEAGDEVIAYVEKFIKKHEVMKGQGKGKKDA